MWISRQGMSRDGRQEAARVGVVSLPGDPAAVLLDGERRQVPAWNLAPGEVVLYSGGGAASIRIRNDGVISMSGTVLVNGLPVMVEGG